MVKTMANTLLDHTGSPAHLWLLCLMHVCFILNFACNATVNGIPMQKCTGSTPDIGPLLRFQWLEPIHCKIDDSDFPSDSHEGRGKFVGIAQDVGHAMTFKILTDDARKITH